MHSICIVMAELINDLGYTLVFMVCTGFSYNSFQATYYMVSIPCCKAVCWDLLKRALLSFIIELIVEETLYRRIHLICSVASKNSLISW